MKNIDKLVEIFVRCDDFYQEFHQFLTARSVEDPLKKNSLHWNAAWLLPR
jgi:hypothetical protein